MSAARRVFMVVLVAGLALVPAACGAEESEEVEGFETDIGVTAEPCPDSENEDRGCIYLGLLSDLTEGPFAPLGVEIVRGQEDFWARVNEQGGIGDAFDVNVTEYTRDNLYNPEEHVAQYREIEPDILALGQSLGTPMTIAAIDLYDQDNVIAVPATWWSGWAFEDEGTVVESGYSYCVEAINGLDYAADEFDSVESVLVVGYPGDYGGDFAAGSEFWAEQNDAEIESIETAPNAQAGNQNAVVSSIRRSNPDVVMLATGPAEAAEIVATAVAGGFEGEFVGSVPTYNPAVLESDAAEAIQERYRFVAPWGPFGTDTPAHQAMEEAVGNELPANDGYTFGWIWSYPMLSALEAAAENEDLTREGLRSAVEEMTVDYEGALEDRQYGNPEEDVVKQALIAVPDPDAPLGASVEREFFVGETAEQFEVTEPCAAAG